jgi:predicted nucleic acid-binding protein
MVFLDASVVLEIILKDRPHLEQAQQFLETLTDDTAISILTVHLLMYFGRKQGIADELLENVIGENELLSIAPEDYVWASLNERGKDFEDALQVATAIRNGCKSFITFDATLAKAYEGCQIEMVLLPR